MFRFLHGTDHALLGGKIGFYGYNPVFRVSRYSVQSQNPISPVTQSRRYRTSHAAESSRYQNSFHSVPPFLFHPDFIAVVIRN